LRSDDLVKSKTSLGFIVLTAALVRLPALRERFYSNDEATYSALAAKLLSGGRMYVDAIDHKPPGIATLYAAIFRLAGVYHMIPVRLVLIAVVAATGIALAELAVVLTGDRRARIAGLLYVLASATGLPDNVQAANAELFLNLPSSLAALAAARLPAARGALRAGLLGITAGALTGGAALFKYQAALAGLAWLWPLVRMRGRPATSVSAAAGMAAGFCLVAAGLLGHYARSGELGAFVFWGWRYNLDYIVAVPLGRQAYRAVAQTAVIAVFWLPLVAFALRAGRRPQLAWAWAATMAVAVSIGGRFFGNYYLLLLPPLAILAASGAVTLLDRGARIRCRAIGVAAASLSVLSAVATLLWYDLRPSVREDDARYRAVGEWIRAEARPGDRLLVWGDSAQIYVYSGCVMGTRFAFCNYHTGKIWGTGADLPNAKVDLSRIVPRAWQELFGDLQNAPPAFIADAAAGGLHGFDGCSLDRYPELWRLVQAKYRIKAVVAGVPLYERVTF
jgi:hypothetical protein